MAIQSSLTTTLDMFLPKSRLSISSNIISCSGFRNKLPGLPVTIDKFSIVGDTLTFDAADWAMAVGNLLLYEMDIEGDPGSLVGPGMTLL